jgi:hypothetical protein
VLRNFASRIGSGCPFAQITARFWTTCSALIEGFHAPTMGRLPSQTFKHRSRDCSRMSWSECRPPAFYSVERKLPNNRFA